MPILTKAQLEQLNQVSFPDQSSEAITPQILREYNTATIDTLVDSLDTGSFTTDISALNAFTASQQTINSGVNAYTASNDTKWNTLGGQTGSFITDVNALNQFTASQESKDSTLATYTGSNDTKWNTLGSQSGSWIIESETGSFATTGSNTFNGNQNIVGQLTASFLRVENNTHLDGTLRVTNDTEINGDLTIQSATPNLKLRDTSGGGFSSGYDVRVDTGSFEIFDDTHDRNVLSDIFNPSTSKHITSLTSEVIVISGSDSVTIQGNLTASLQEGDMWVGNGSNKNSTIPSASFAKLSESNTFTGNLNQFQSISALSASFGQINYVTGSATIIGDAFIVLNTDTPALRYAGLQVMDSGSGGTASLEWDGDVDKWLVVDEGGNSAYLISGPTGSLGNEVSLTDNKLAKSGTDNQLIDSSITDNGTTVAVGANLSVTGSITSNGTSVLLDGALSGLNGFTQSQEILNDTFATTGSNTFVDNQIVNGVVTQNVVAPADNTQKDFITVSGATINGVPYNYVNQSIQNYPSFGAAYSDAFITEYYDSTSYLYGAEFIVNGGRVGGTLTASGSGTLASFRIQDQYNGTTFGNFYADEIQIGEFVAGTRTRIGIGHIALPSLDLRANNIVVTGSILQSGGNSTFAADVTMNSNLNVGLNITADKLVLTGGTGLDLIVTGSGRISNALNVGVLGGESAFLNQYGFSAINDATGDDFGLTGNGTDYGVSGWAGPSIYGNNPDDEYPAFIGFQNKADWTDGAITVLKPLNITGSLSVSGSMNSSVIQLGITSNTASLNAGLGNTFQLNLVSGSETRLEVSGTKSGQTINLLVSQSATGPGTLVFGDNIVEPSGSFYSASAIASAEDILTMATFINADKLYLANIKNFI